ncbi:hypothetical protein D3Z33_08595 [Senegalia massiliensis]|uniref:Uncharacterized protein n=1 Tax=Senegalia massiliensis TaxID=1720316 RepID=A0A845QXL8_9CLOT|nr:hypothetical protein [Senegalia massiliensis]
MKRIIILNIVLIILFFSIDNNNFLNISSTELLGTGYNYLDKSIHKYNYILNISSIIMFILFIQSSISSVDKLKYYIVSKGGYKALKLNLCKSSLKSVIIIILIKHVIYFFEYFMSSNLEFYYFDMISSFITLITYSMILIIFKLMNIKDFILSLIFISTIILAQFLSYKHFYLSYIVIASYNWRTMYLNIILVKSILLVLCIFILFRFKKIDLL